MIAIRRLIGLGVIGLTILLVVSPENCRFLIHIPSMAFVLGITCGGLLISFRPATIAKALAACFRDHAKLTGCERNVYSRIFTHAQLLFWASGFLGFMIGLIMMLHVLEDFSKIGVGVGVCLLSMFYGMIFAEFIIRPMRSSILAGGESTEPIQADATSSAGDVRGYVIAGTCVLLGMMALLVTTFA